MTKFRLICTMVAFVCLLHVSLMGGDPGPVTPNPSPEAKALLELMYSLSGQYTITGQHNYPNTRDRNSQFAAQYSGEHPAVWSTDMGFAEAGDTDSYLARPDIVDEAIRQHQQGSIITICWHAVPPTADEPVVFRQGPGASKDSLASVQGQLLDKQFQDVLTPGTALYKKWCAQVDSVAFYLKKLQEAKVPVLWRPYHEMNGNWFWWGGRHGKYSTRALYRQMFDRLVKHHKINNLVWMWSVDRPNNPPMYFSHYYPGNDYLDIVSLDVYGSDFNQTYYDSLTVLAKGKPMVLGEVGNPPSLEIFENQPNWAMWVIWAGMARNTSKAQYEIFYDSTRMLTRDDSAYAVLTAPYRKACNLPGLKPVNKARAFSGEWVLNEDQCATDNFGLSNAAYKMSLALADSNFQITRSFIVEWGDDRITEENLKLDGTPFETTFWNLPRILTASWAGDTVVVESFMSFNWGGQTREIKGKESWSLSDKGRILTIREDSQSFRGPRKVTLVYEKKSY